MAIWNLLRDFFVQYIFGGYTSTGENFKGVIGFQQNTQNIYVSVDNILDASGNVAKLTVGDYLSTTATIITLVVFVGILFLFLKWLFKVISGFILLK